MRILGIETTCDETGVALVEDGKIVLAERIASQTEIHRAHGGVFPDLAASRHLEVLLPLIEEVLGDAEIDAIAVADRPGLIGSLLAGVQTARSLALMWNKPLICVDHVEAHLYATGMTQELLYPALGLVVSGGHTSLYHMEQAGQVTLLCGTRDDAIGEAFDKVGRLLGLSYPAGPEMERLAAAGTPSFPLKGSKLKDSFSFSGLKTSARLSIEGWESAHHRSMDAITKQNMAAAFQKAAFESLIAPIKTYMERGAYHGLVVGGGVSLNQAMRVLLREKLACPVFFPEAALCGDNAAMIAGLAYALSAATQFTQ